jgi:DNA-binding transcriptional LysR family regulator
MAFEACLRLGSVTQAAEELSLAQPTVSGLLRRLSETVGEPVLRLHRGRMEATSAGRELAVLCDDVFNALARFDARRTRPHCVVNEPAYESAHVPIAAPMLATSRSAL